MTIQKLAGYGVSAVLFFFAVIYALASSYDATRIVVSIVLFAVGFGVLFFTVRHKPTQVIQRLEVPGKISAQIIKCPNCSAALDADQIRIVEGTPLAKCTYCGHTFELVEEPKW